MRRRNISSKHILILIIIIFIIILAIFSFTLKEDRQLNKFESLIKDTVTSVTKVVAYPFNWVFNKIDDFKELVDIREKYQKLLPQVDRIDSLTAENAELRKQLEAMKEELDIDYIINDSGFINLDDSYNIIYGKKSNIMISGISSNIESNKTVNEKLSESINYSNNNETNYKILLIHEPDYIDEIKDIEYDLILSGHSHNGQVRLPIIGAIYKPIGSKKYYDNHYILDKKELFISSGLGTSIVNLRLFNKPSINFYRITNK